MGEKTRGELLIADKKRLSALESEIVMHNYVNGWLLKSYRAEVIVLKERIKKLEEND